MTRRPARRRGRPSKPLLQRTADTLEVGDVIMWDRQRAVVIEASDEVGSAPLDQVFGGTPASRCCEPRIQFISDAGRLTHRTTHIIVPNARRFIVIDRRLDVRDTAGDDDAGDS